MVSANPFAFELRGIYVAFYVKSGLEMASAQSTLFYLSAGSESPYPSSPALLWMLPLSSEKVKAGCAFGAGQGSVYMCVCFSLSNQISKPNRIYFWGGTHHGKKDPCLFSSPTQIKES